MTPVSFIRDLAKRIAYPDGKPYCRDGACPHLQARAVLDVMEQPPEIAVMAERARAALSPSMIEADMEDDLRDALARDVQTLLAERLRALTALEDAVPELRAIKERHAARVELDRSPQGWTTLMARTHQDVGTTLGLVNLLALTVAERDARLEAAGRAYNAADLRASEAEAEVAVLRANQEAILNRVREGLYLPEGEYDADWILDRVATVARLHRETAGAQAADLP